MKSIIRGVGHYVPEQVVTNADLEKMMDTSNEWIIERTGILERRYFKEGFDTTSSMGVKAAEMALERAQIHKSEIDLIIFATLSPDYNFPGSGVLLQRQMGLDTIPAFDIRQQCSGFVYGLSMADAFIKSGAYKNILLVGSEVQSNIIDHSNKGRNIAVIFGDGAGAVVISRSEEDNNRGIISTHLHSQGEFAGELILEHPGSKRKERLTKEMLENEEHRAYMNGPAVFKHAVTRFMEVINEGLAANNLTSNDVDLLIPHQANLRISEYIQRKMNLRDDQVYNNIQRYGNTTAASIPIALSEAFAEGKVKPGDLLCMAAFGSGFTWGSAFVRF
jgi:3-oxoacyl-[acyl-carrier-protein] synthase III